MPDQDPLRELYATMDASTAAFSAGDIDGWLAGNHPSVHSFQGDRFMTMADFDAGVAELQTSISAEWNTIWREGVVEGNAGCVWGEVEWTYQLSDERHVTRIACSWYYVRMDGAWKAMFSHYTPLGTSSPS
jgi:hypothetical protein